MVELKQEKNLRRNLDGMQMIGMKNILKINFITNIQMISLKNLRKVFII